MKIKLPGGRRGRQKEIRERISYGYSLGLDISQEGELHISPLVLADKNGTDGHVEVK